MRVFCSMRQWVHDFNEQSRGQKADSIHITAKANDVIIEQMNLFCNSKQWYHDVLNSANCNGCKK